MRLALAVLALVVAAPAPALPGAKAIRSCAALGRTGRHRRSRSAGVCVGRVQGAAASPACSAAARAEPLDPGFGPAHRRPVGVRRRLDPRHGRRGLQDRSEDRSDHRAPADGGVCAVQPLGRSRLALVGRRQDRRGPPHRSNRAQGDAENSRGRRSRRPRLPRRARLGDQPPRSRPRSDRRHDEPAPPPHHRSRRRARADRVGGRVALGDRPRHRPASARSGNRGCSRRRSRSAWAESTSSPPPARSGCRRAQRPPTSRLSHHDLAPPRRPATGKVTTPLRTSRRIDVHGLVPYGRGVLFSDNTGGNLYAVPR